MITYALFIDCHHFHVIFSHVVQKQWFVAFRTTFRSISATHCWLSECLQCLCTLKSPCLGHYWLCPWSTTQWSLESHKGFECPGPFWVPLGSPGAFGSPFSPGPNKNLLGSQGHMWNNSGKKNLNFSFFFFLNRSRLILFCNFSIEMLQIYKLKM